MSKGIRNVLIGLMILFTAAVVVACLGAGAGIQNDIYYDVAYDTAVNIVDVKAVCLGTSYNGKKSTEGKVYYRLDITLRNDTNVNVYRYGTSFCYDTAEDSGYVDTVYNDGIFSSADRYLIPAGTEAKTTAIVQIPEECKGVELYTWDDEAVRYELVLQ